MTDTRVLTPCYESWYVLSIRVGDVPLLCLAWFIGCLLLGTPYPANSRLARHIGTLMTKEIIIQAPFMHTRPCFQLDNVSISCRDRPYPLFVGRVVHLGEMPPRVRANVR